MNDVDRLLESENAQNQIKWEPPELRIESWNGTASFY